MSVFGAHGGRYSALGGCGAGHGWLAEGGKR